MKNAAGEDDENQSVVDANDDYSHSEETTWSLGYLESLGYFESLE